jgi:hypothetical protein
MWFARTLLDPFGADLPRLQTARYGVIETRRGRLWAIHLRTWPKLISTLEADWLARRYHDHRPGDRCLLYYNQPLWHANYLALAFVLSYRDCTFATSRCAARVLDEIARVKRSDALLCDAWNGRISERLLARWGWEPHTGDRWHRNYIKRFYGTYPAERKAFVDEAASSWLDAGEETRHDAPSPVAPG